MFALLFVEHFEKLRVSYVEVIRNFFAKFKRRAVFAAFEPSVIGAAYFALRRKLFPRQSAAFSVSFPISPKRASRICALFLALTVPQEQLMPNVDDSRPNRLPRTLSFKVKFCKEIPNPHQNDKALPPRKTRRFKSTTP